MSTSARIMRSVETHATDARHAPATALFVDLVLPPNRLRRSRIWRGYFQWASGASPLVQVPLPCGDEPCPLFQPVPTLPTHAGLRPVTGPRIVHGCAPVRSRIGRSWRPCPP
jgi:hypothetical protein